MWEYFGSVKLYVWLQRSQFSLFKYVSINTCKHLYSCTQRCTHRNAHVCAGIDKSGYVDNFPLNFACTCQHRWPKPPAAGSDGERQRCLAVSLLESAARPLPAPGDSRSSSAVPSEAAAARSAPSPRGAAAPAPRSAAPPPAPLRPAPPRLAARVHIPAPGGRAGIPANDSEIQRVNALVIWSTEPSRQLSCTFFPPPPSPSITRCLTLLISTPIHL